MSYTPTTWNTGDTISASALNKIENGIANAGDCKIAVVSLSASGYNSSSRTFGRVVYAVQNNSHWEVIIDDDNDWMEIFGYDAPKYRVLQPLIIPSDGSMYPFLVDVSADAINTTGDISDTAENVYYSWGSLVINGGYRISGSGSIEFASY